MAQEVILVTGASGALGPALLTDLLAGERRVAVLVRPGRDRAALDERLKIVAGDVTDAASFTRAGLESRDVGVVIHAAADTRFRAPRDEQERVNVQGTRNMLAWARQFPNPRRVRLLSTTLLAAPARRADLADL